MKTFLPFALAILLLSAGAFQNRSYRAPAVAECTQFKTNLGQ